MCYLVMEVANVGMGSLHFLRVHADDLNEAQWLTEQKIAAVFLYNIFPTHGMMLGVLIQIVWNTVVLFTNTSYRFARAPGPSRQEISSTETNLS
jgi:hypothetical protein